MTDKTSEIQDQTRLLVINALIEAARAGEAGEKLALIASEIRELSDSPATGST